MKAKDILKDDETAIVIFTDGLNLVINDNGTGESGVWRISKNASADKVIIYKRDKSKNITEIHIGNFIQLLPSKVKDLKSVLQLNLMI